MGLFDLVILDCLIVFLWPSNRSLTLANVSICRFSSLEIFYTPAFKRNPAPTLTNKIKISTLVHNDIDQIVSTSTYVPNSNAQWFQEKAIM